MAREEKRTVRGWDGEVARETEGGEGGRAGGPKIQRAETGIKGGGGESEEG